MRSAFTLMEVMVAAMIITFMGWGILQLQSNTVHNMDMMKGGFDTAVHASPLLVTLDQKNHQKSKDLYSFVKERYKIDYDPMISAMKKSRLTFRQREYGFITIEESLDENGQVRPTQSAGLLIYHNSVTAKQGTTSTLSFEMNR